MPVYIHRSTAGKSEALPHNTAYQFNDIANPITVYKTYLQ